MWCRLFFLLAFCNLKMGDKEGRAFTCNSAKSEGHCSIFSLSIKYFGNLQTRVTSCTTCTIVFLIDLNFGMRVSMVTTIQLMSMERIGDWQGDWEEMCYLDTCRDCSIGIFKGIQIVKIWSREGILLLKFLCTC